MIEFSVMITAATFLVILLLTSRPCYLFILRHVAKREAKRLQISLKEVTFSFDQMVYLIALPTTIPEVRNATKENLIIKPYYESYFFPSVAGVHVSVQGEERLIFIAYLPIEDFSLPILDHYLEKKTINERINQMIRAHLIVRHRTLRAIRDEVFQKIHKEQLNDTYHSKLKAK